MTSSTSSHNPLASTWLYHHAQLHGRLGNVEIRRKVLVNSCPVSTTKTKLLLFYSEDPTQHNTMQCQVYTCIFKSLLASEIFRVLQFWRQVCRRGGLKQTFSPAFALGDFPALCFCLICHSSASIPCYSSLHGLLWSRNDNNKTKLEKRVRL